MRPPVLVFACLTIPCLFLAQMVSCVPVYDGNQIRTFNADDLTDDGYGDIGYFLEPDKRDRSNRREIAYCMDWIHNTWRPCRGRKAG